MQLAYQIALYALVPLILLTGEGRMKRTVLIILAVMGAAYLLRGMWPSAPYAWSMIAVDFAALVGICMRPAGKWQSVIGLTYAMQMSVHFGRIIVGDNTDMNAYWWGLSVVAFLQLFLLGGWWTKDVLIARLSRRNSHPRGYLDRDAELAG